MPSDQLKIRTDLHNIIGDRIVRIMSQTYTPMFKLVLSLEKEYVNVLQYTRELPLFVPGSSFLPWICVISIILGSSS